jgi:hypothetical protein
MRSKTGTTAELSAREKQLKADIKEMEAAMRSEYQTFIANGGSIDQLKEKLKQLQREYRALSEAERRGGKGIALKQEITSTITAIKTADGEISGHTQKVKEYQGTMTKALSGTWSFLKYISYLIPGLGIAGLFDLAVQGLKALWDEVRKNNGALDQFKRKIEITAEALKDSGYLDAKAKVASLKEELKLATEGKISAKKAIDDYNDSLGKATGGVASLGEMERKLSQSSEAYLQMLALKTKATIAYRKAAEEGVLADIEMNEYGQFGAGFMRFLKTPSEWFKNPLPSKNANPFQAQIDYADSKRKSENLLNKLGDDYQRQAALLAEKYKLNFFNDTKIKDGPSIASRVYQDTKQLKALLDEIEGSKEKYQIEFGPKLESEELKINKYFDDLTKKVDEFNKDPKRKVKLTQEQINTAKSEIESGRQYALGLADDKERGEILVKQLAEQKKLYKEYEDFKTKYGEQAANDLYDNLTAKYKTYLDRVQAEYNKLEKKGETGLSPAEADVFSKLTTLLSEAKNIKQSDQTQWFVKALSEYQSFAQNRISIEERYNEEIKKATEKGWLDLIAGIEKAKENELSRVDADNLNTITRTREMFDDIILITTEAVKQQISRIEYLLDNTALTPEQRNHLIGKLSFTKSLLGESQDQRELAQINEDIKNTKKELEDAEKAGIKTGAVLDQLKNKLAALEANKAAKELDIFRKKLQTVADLAPSISDLGQSLQELGGDSSALSEMGAILSGVGSQLGNLINVFNKVKTEGVSSMDAIATAAQFVLQTISMIVSSAAQRRIAEQQFEVDRLSFQYGMNDAVMKELEARQEMNRLSFSANWSQDMLDAQERLVLASKKYYDSLNDIGKIQVKIGQRNKVDWGKTASSTLSGVAAGAAIGSVVPVIGTAIGAVVGGVIGFVSGIFGSKKKKDVWGGVLQEYPELLQQTADGVKVVNVELAKQLISSNLIDEKGKIILQNIINQAEEYKEVYKEISKIVDDVIGDLGDKLRSSLVQAFKDGEDAANVFKKTVSSIIEELISQAAYAAIFEPFVEQLKQDMKDSYAIGGDMNWVDDIMRFLEVAEGGAQAFYDFIAKSREAGKSYNIDLFVPSQQSGKNKNSLSGAISSASQESIDVLSGHTMGMRVAQLKTNEILTWGFSEGYEIANRSLDRLEKIAKNTYDTVQELKTLNNKIQSGSDLALAMGGL